MERLEAVPSNNNGPITIGAVIPISGNVAAVGLPIRKAAELALSEINQDGGVNGRRLKLEVRDGRCDAREAVNAAETFINIDRVQVIFAGGCSSETLAMSPLAERARVILFSPSATSPEISKAGQYVFRNAPSDASQGRLLADAAFNKGYRKVGILQEETDYAVGIGSVFSERFKNLGGLVNTISYRSEAEDVQQELQTLRDAEIDALLFAVQSPAKADMILNHLRADKLRWPLFTNDVATGASAFGDQQFEEITEGLMAADFGVDETNPLYQEFIGRYQQAYGEDVAYPLYAALSYDAIYLLRDAIKSAGTNADSIRSYLAKVKDRPGAGGTLTFDENGDPLSGHVLKQIVKGEFVQLQPLAE